MSFKTLRASVRQERKVLRAKERIVRVLGKLSDEDSRKRVMVATAALHGFPICTIDEHPGS